jgi:release factor glutamine methyltransferase
MMTVEQALRAYPLPRLESRLLLMHVDPSLTHARIVAHPEAALDADCSALFRELAERRVAGEPLAYLLGEREFFGRPFAVGPSVLIPRPETEHLVEAALARVPAGAIDAVDLGCGSGAIAVTLALEAPQWHVAAVDVSADALAVARGNAQRLAARVEFFLGSWFSPLPVDRQFDLIVSNPPYIAQDDHHLGEGDVRFEPRLALSDGGDGLGCLRAIAAGAPVRLRKGGWLMVEHGFDQGRAARDLLTAAGLTAVETLPDLAGLDRVTLGQMRG